MTSALSAGRPDVQLGGRYRLEHMVGRGGSAEVWRAEDEALGRRVAVKLVTASGGEDAGRVGDEARLLARLSHPGLVPVYDAGTDDVDRPYVVMELVEGETLADAVGRGPIDSERVATIGRVLAEALSYVHGQGLVHRDVKPHNVLLGQDGRVRLTDFGIARLVDAAKVTATGLTVGTASYLSPEQVTGSGVGPPSDVYSLGLVLLECLTGRREYPGSAVEVALARLSRQPVVPASLPAGWPGLLEAMTAREPAPRPPADQVARELATIGAGGSATTVLSVVGPDDERTQLIDRTQLLDRTQLIGGTGLVEPVGAYERAPLVDRRRDAPRPVEPARPLPPAQGSGWRWVLLLVALLAAAVVGFLFVDQRSSDPGPLPPGIDLDLPEPLRSSLDQLQQEVLS